ncbi:hypothetical protein ACVWZL_007065 [Bradyrhizobium sp. GM2.4]
MSAKAATARIVHRNTRWLLGIFHWASSPYQMNESDLVNFHYLSLFRASGV